MNHTPHEATGALDLGAIISSFRATKADAPWAPVRTIAGSWIPTKPADGPRRWAGPFAS